MALFDKRFQYIISSTGLLYFISIFLCTFISVLSFDENTTPPHEWFVELASMTGVSLLLSTFVLFISFISSCWLTKQVQKNTSNNTPKLPLRRDPNPFRSRISHSLSREARRQI